MSMTYKGKAYGSAVQSQLFMCVCNYYHNNTHVNQNFALPPKIEFKNNVSIFATREECHKDVQPEITRIRKLYFRNPHS